MTGTRRQIEIETLILNPINIWAQRWLALACGDFFSGHFNAMTVAWGSFGTMWARSFAQVVVRPSRYTFEFMERYDNFTLSVFPESCRKALEVLGTTSGRNGNKIAAAGLTPVAASRVSAPSFAEAELTIECRKIYWDDLEPGHFLDPAIGPNYTDGDYHRIYFGEIVAVTAAG